jgi:RsiW-degrading membrane proteinase PrsW (M82 family)
MTGPQADLLVQVLPDGAEMRFQPGQQVLIGRDTDVQVLVAHPRASRHHALLTYQQDGWVLTDQSSNGTFVDGRPIHQLTVHGPVAIRVGDPGDGTGIRLAMAIAGPVPPALDPGVYQAAQAISPSPAGFAPAPPAPAPPAPSPAGGFAAQPAPGFASPPVPGLGAPAGFDANGATPETGTPSPVGILAPAQGSPVPGFDDPPPAPDPVLPPGPGYGGPPAPGPGHPAGPAAPLVLDYATPPAQGTPLAAGYGTPPGHGTALLPASPGQPPGYPPVPGTAFPPGPGGAYPGGPPPPGAHPPGTAAPPGPVKAKGRGRGGSDHREPRVAALASSLHILVPVRSWLNNPGWTQGFRLLVVVYGLLPSVFIVLFVKTSNLTTPGWAYSLYLAPLWAMVFYYLIRPGKITKTVIVLAVATIIGTLGLIQLLTIPWEDALGKATSSHPKQVLPWIYGVGYAEEVTKALPVLATALIVLYFRKEKLDVRMWMLLGTIAGLTFGVAESVKYVASYLNITQHHAGVGVPVVLLFADRVFGDGFQHAVWAGISGFFIGMGVNYRRQRILLIAIGVSIPSVLHGLSDWSTTSSTQWYWIGFLALSLILFLGYSMSASVIERQVRKTPIFRGESMLMDRPSGFSEIPAPSPALRVDPEPGVSARPG